MLRDLQCFLEDVGGLVLNEEEIAVGFVFADLLHNAEIVDGGEEITPREVCFGFSW